MAIKTCYVPAAAFVLCFVATVAGALPPRIVAAEGIVLKDQPSLVIRSVYTSGELCADAPRAVIDTNSRVLLRAQIGPADDIGVQYSALLGGYPERLRVLVAVGQPSPVPDYLFVDFSDDVDGSPINGFVFLAKIADATQALWGVFQCDRYGVIHKIALAGEAVPSTFLPGGQAVPGVHFASFARPRMGDGALDCYFAATFASGLGMPNDPEGIYHSRSGVLRKVVDDLTIARTVPGMPDSYFYCSRAIVVPLASPAPGAWLYANDTAGGGWYAYSGATLTPAFRTGDVYGVLKVSSIDSGVQQPVDRYGVQLAGTATLSLEGNPVARVLFHAQNASAPVQILLAAFSAGISTSEGDFLLDLSEPRCDVDAIYFRGTALRPSEVLTAGLWRLGAQTGLGLVAYDAGTNFGAFVGDYWAGNGRDSVLLPVPSSVVANTISGSLVGQRSLVPAPFESLATPGQDVFLSGGTVVSVGGIWTAFAECDTHVPRSDGFGRVLFATCARSSSGICSSFDNRWFLTGYCELDFNNDQVVNPDDLGDFITAYFEESIFRSVCDYNRDGVVNPDDLGDFITDYYTEGLCA